MPSCRSLSRMRMNPPNYPLLALLLGGHQWIPHQEPDGPSTNSTDPPEDKKRDLRRTAVTVAAAVAGGVVAVGSVPVLLGAMGFTSAGIAASSIAAKMMSAAAIANGGGVASSSLVATLQSVGAAGLSTSSNILLGLTGSSLGAWWGSAKKKTSTQAGPDTEGKRGPDVGATPKEPGGSEGRPLAQLGQLPCFPNSKGFMSSLPRGSG
ncbi:PREDICTED: interferon alpha-inducible protein 27-like protein 2 [Miniopterus natalensis]|uniref:interferon alpha-inducible protein 27-like protein 2 n=1 Tax=Miniopterus natalensis TaxID=291302 RepID=UPI0007A6B59D|nr:PREDICTED: interferon alpha-inducible protein 27-like protein 2 [Miniopterus natalensis]